ILALTLLVTLLTPPVYRATTTLQIDREAMRVVQVEGMQSPEAANSGDFYQTQYELLQSRALAERTADTLDLAHSSSLERLANNPGLSRLVPSLRPETRGATAAAGKEAKTEALREAVGVVKGGRSIGPVRNSRLVKVSSDSGNPVSSARVANAQAEAF